MISANLTQNVLPFVAPSFIGARALDLESWALPVWITELPGLRSDERALFRATRSLDASERSAVFDVVRFHKGYINAENAPDLLWSQVGSNTDQIFIRAVNIGGIGYNVTLQWDTRSQKFEIVDITRLSPK